jgi:protein-S-isoprenylcysteine O-methyltransferase Ste14
MNKPDDLEQLWKTQPVDPAVKGEEMRKIVLKKTEKFDRTIRRRNMREMIAASVVAVAFMCIAWAQHNAIERAGSIILVAGALWIIYYMWRYGAEPPDPSPDQTLEGYQRALVRKYDHQIRLLRGVKFWYLLPIYVGLLTGSAGLLKKQADKGTLTWGAALFPLFYTLVFAAIWWLNEVYGVRKLERMRAQVTSGIDEGETQC